MVDQPTAFGFAVAGAVAERITADVLGSEHPVTVAASRIGEEATEAAEERFLAAVDGLPEPQRSQLMEALQRRLRRANKRARKVRGPKVRA